MTSNPLMSFAARILKLEQEAAARKAPQLQASSVHGGRMQHYDNGGQPTLAMGLTGDGTHAVVYQTGPIPPAPTNVDAVGGQLQVVATWDGTFDNGAPAPNDFDMVEVHAGTTSDFTPDTGLSSTTRVGEILHPQGSSVTFMAATGDVWVTMVTRTKSGAVSTHAHVCGTTVTDAVDSSVLDEAKANLDAANKQIAQAQADLNASQGTLTTLNTNLQTAQSNIAELQADQTTTQQALAQVNTDLYGDAGKVAQVQQSLTGQITDAQAKAQQALNAAQQAQNASSGGVQTFYQADAPTTANKGDIWVDSNNTAHRWDGTSWNVIADSQVSAALAAAQSAQKSADAAQATASGKNQQFFGTTSPSGNGVVKGDLWTQYSIANNVMRTLATWMWDGTMWQSTALTETYLPQVNIGTGTYGELDGFRLKAASVQANTVVVPGSVGNVLIANGAVDASKIQAQSVAGAVGSFLKLDVGQLTASNATVDSGVVNTLWSNLFAANKITANLIDAQSIAAATATLIKVDASQLTVTGTSTFADAVVQQLWVQTFAANKITADQINSASISAALATIQTVKAENIQSGFLNASLGMGTTGAIMAGNWSGTYARMDQTGFSTWNVGADGTQYQGTSLGSSTGNDALTIADATGHIQAAIGADGSISGSSGNFDGDVIVDGTPLVGQALAQDGTTFGWLDSLPQGIVQGGFGDFTGLVSGATLSNSSATLGLLTVDCEPGRIYRFTMPVAYYVHNNSSADVTCKVTAFYTTDSGTPTDPTTSSPILAVTASDYSKSFSYVTGGVLTAIYNSPATTPQSTMKILIVAQVNNADMAFSVSDAGQWRAWVEDLGPTVTSTARVAAALSGQTAKTNGSTTDQNQLVEKRTFTTTWEGSAAQIYGAANGAKYNFAGAAHGFIGQGSYDGSNANNMRSAIVFNNTAISGESATMQNALNGATITKAQVFMYFPHWYYSTGGNSVIHPLGGTSIPSTLSSVSSSSVTTKFTAQAQGIWVTVPNSWFTTSNTGITVTAPDATTNNYGYFSGPGVSTASQRVQVRLTYTR